MLECIVLVIIKAHCKKSKSKKIYTKDIVHACMHASLNTCSLSMSSTSAYYKPLKEQSTLNYMIMMFCITLDECVRVGDCDGGGVSVFTPFDLGLIMPSILSISSCDIVQRVVGR